MTALSDKSRAITVLEHVLEDLAPAQASLVFAQRVLKTEGLTGFRGVDDAHAALKEANRRLRREIHNLEEYWASGEPERLAALDAEVPK